MPSLDLGPVVGPQGEQGATGAQGIRGEQGLPGPNQVTNSTATPLTGVLTGNGSVVGVASIDAAPTADSTGFAQSGGTDKAIKGRVPVYGRGVNLLRNWYFVGGGTGRGVSPVNQRGQSSYTGVSYSIDGWYVRNASALVELTSSGLKLKKNTVNYADFGQYLSQETLNILSGKTVTLSWLDDVDCKSVSFTWAASSTPLVYSADNLNIYAGGNSPNAYNCLFQTTTTEKAFKAVKLELGSEQTLCHNEGTDANPVWVMNDVPDYEYELYRCITSTADPSDTYANKSLITEPNLSHGPYTASGGTMDVEYFYKSVGEFVYVTGIATPTANTGVAGISDVTFSDLPKNMDSTAPMFISTNTCSVSSGDLRPAINIAYLGGKSVRFQGQATNNRPFQFGFVYC